MNKAFDLQTFLPRISFSKLNKNLKVSNLWYFVGSFYVLCCCCLFENCCGPLFGGPGGPPGGGPPGPRY